MIHKVFGENIEWFRHDIAVSYKAIDHFIAHTDFSKYDFVIHLGVSTNSQYIKIETVAHNYVNGTDILSEKKNHTIVSDGPNEIGINSTMLEKSTFYVVDKNKLVSSENAGKYLCNYIFYKSLFYHGDKCKIIFIHTADTQNNTSAPCIEVQANEILELIRYFCC